MMKKIKSVIGFKLPVVTWFLGYILAYVIAAMISNKIAVSHALVFFLVFIPMAVITMVWVDSD